MSNGIIPTRGNVSLCHSSCSQPMEHEDFCDYCEISLTEDDIEKNVIIAQFCPKCDVLMEQVRVANSLTGRVSHLSSSQFVECPECENVHFKNPD